MTKVPTLALYYGKLKVGEKAIILNAVKQLRDNYRDLHPGVLPFVPMDAVLSCLEFASRSPPHRRVYARLLEKLEYYRWMKFESFFTLYLNPKKVAKRFGSHPERGQRLNIVPKKRVTVGVKPVPFSSEKKPDDDVLVAPCAALEAVPGQPTFWRVKCEPKYQAQVSLWLIDNCR